MNSEGETNSTPLAGPQARCLLLTPRGFEAPFDLLEGLRRRRVTVQEVNDAPAVMVALATAATGGTFVAVVLVEPQAMRDSEALLAAIQKHHRVAVWRYRHEADPRFERIYAPPKAQDEAHAAPPRAIQRGPKPGTQPGAQPGARHADAPRADGASTASPTADSKTPERQPEPAEPAAPGKPAEPAERAGVERASAELDPLPTVLSEEELAMLLDPRPGQRPSDDPREAEGGGR